MVEDGTFFETMETVDGAAMETARDAAGAGVGVAVAVAVAVVGGSDTAGAGAGTGAKAGVSSGFFTVSAVRAFILDSDETPNPVCVGKLIKLSGCVDGGTVEDTPNPELSGPEDGAAAENDDAVPKVGALLLFVGFSVAAAGGTPRPVPNGAVMAAGAEKEDATPKASGATVVEVTEPVLTDVVPDDATIVVRSTFSADAPAAHVGLLSIGTVPSSS